MLNLRNIVFVCRALRIKVNSFMIKERFEHYKLNIPDIDEQHLEIISMLNQLRMDIQAPGCLFIASANAVNKECNQGCSMSQRCSADITKAQALFAEHVEYEEEYMLWRICGR